MLLSLALLGTADLSDIAVSELLLSILLVLGIKGTL